MSRILFPRRRRPRKSQPAPEHEWSGTPDLIGHIEGARVWRLNKDGDRLLSVVRDIIWEPGGRLESECLPQGAGGLQYKGGQWATPCETPPQPACRCGLWGVYDFNETDQRSAWKPGRRSRWTGDAKTAFIGGAIQGWGRVVEGRIGFRAQYARILLLTRQGYEDEPQVIEKLAEIYQAPIVDRMPTFKKPE